MNKRLWSAFTTLFGLIILTLFVIPSGAQKSDTYKKPLMYVYTANWLVPRAHWADKEKANAADKAILEKALADGTIVGYGDDENLLHQRDDFTHDKLVGGHVTGWGHQGARPAPRISQRDVLCLGKCHRVPGSHLHKPVLPLASWPLQERLRSRIVLQNESGRARRCNRHA
jgi:hypothetical protein